MEKSGLEKFAPVAGIVCAVLFVCGGLLGDPPGVKASAASHIAWFQDHKAIAILGGVASGYFMLLFAFFAGALRRRLRVGEPAGGTWSSVAWYGAIGVALAVLGNGLLTLVSYEAASNGNGPVVLAAAYGMDLGWFPWAAASGALFLGAGIGSLRTRALPRWLAIVTTVLGVLSVGGPTGIIVFFATPLWLIAVSIVLWRQPVGAASAVDVRVPATAAAVTV